MPLHCVPLPDCSKPPPSLFQCPPPAGVFQSPGQESDSLFSEGSSMASSRHREEGPSHWDQGSDSAKGSTPQLEDQESYWRTSYRPGAPPTSWYPPGPSTLPYPCGINQDLLSATPCRGDQAEIEDWADHNSVFDWDQYKLREEEEEEEKYERKNKGDVESDCKEVVDMEICSIVSESNDEDEGKSGHPTQEVNAFSESDRLTDTQMLSLLRHLSATNKNNDTNKNICHTIELFLTLLPVQLQTDTVELRKASMTSAQRQIFDLLHSKAPWVVDEQVIRSMDLLPFILKRILTSIELQQNSVHAPPTSTGQTPQKSEPIDQHHKRQQPHHRRRRHSPRRSSSPLVHRRGRDRSRSPPARHLASHRDTTPPRQRTNSLPSTAVPQSPPKSKGPQWQCQGRGRNIFTRSPEPVNNAGCPPANPRCAERKPGLGYRAKATVRLQHIYGDEEEQPTEARTAKGAEDNSADQGQPRKLLLLPFNPLKMKRIEAKWKKSGLEAIKKRKGQPALLRQTSTVLRWKKRTNLTKKRLANAKAPSLMALSLPPLSLIRQAVKPTVPKKPVVRPRKPPSLLTVKLPMLAAGTPPSRITSKLLAPPAHKTPMSLAPTTASHRGLLPDPGSQEHLMIMGMETVSRLGLQSKFR